MMAFAIHLTIIVSVIYLRNGMSTMFAMSDCQSLRIQRLISLQYSNSKFTDFAKIFKFEVHSAYTVIPGRNFLTSRTKKIIFSYLTVSQLKWCLRRKKYIPGIHTNLGAFAAYAERNCVFAEHGKAFRCLYSTLIARASSWTHGKINAQQWSIHNLRKSGSTNYSLTQ